MMKMSKSELELMHIIWDSGAPVTCGQLLAKLPEGREWKNTTVLTFLSRLAEKGMVRVEKHGKANVYTAAVSQESYRGQETETFLEDVHGGSVKSLIASLCGSDRLSADELEELKSWLAKR